MTLEDKIKKDYIQSMKDKNIVIKNLISTIIGDIQTFKKNNMLEKVNDSDVVKILTKLNKTSNEMYEKYMNIDSKTESDYISSILPKQLSEDEITNIILELKSSNKDLNIGLVMKHFNNLNADMKKVSEIFRKL